MNIGVVLGVSEAIASTDDNDIDQIVIWEDFDKAGIRHRIECEVWEYSGNPASVRKTLDCVPVDLRPHGGRCHSFQYRAEEMLNPSDPDDVDLIEADESLCPAHLVGEVPTEMREDAAASVENWLQTAYQSHTMGKKV